MVRELRISLIHCCWFVSILLATAFRITQCQFTMMRTTTEADHALMRGDKFILKGLLFHGFHGVLPEERVLGQKFLVDVDAWMDLRAAGKSDNLLDTVDYTDIYRIVKEVIEGPPHNLLESVAEQIATTTLTKHHKITAVRVNVGKPQVAVQGPVDYLGVEILRFRSNLAN